jgi:hypothetical protein
MSGGDARTTGNFGILNLQYRIKNLLCKVNSFISA